MRRLNNEASAPPAAVRDLGKWIRQCLFLIREDDGLFTRLVVRHIVNGKRGDEVLFRNVPKKVKEEWCDSAAQDVFNGLVSEAHSLGGLQKYAVYAYSATDSENHFSRYVIRIQGHDDEDGDGDGLNSEGPDKRGLTSQAMRHAEAFAKLQTSSQMTVVSTLQSLVSQLSSMTTDLMEARRKDFELLEAAMSHKSEREIEVMKAQAKTKAITALGDKLGLFLPALANKVAGQRLFPVQADAVMMMVKGLATSIAGNEDQMSKLMSILSPEQAVVFMNVLEEVSKNVGDNGLPTNANGESPDTESNGVPTANP